MTERPNRLFLREILRGRIGGQRRESGNYLQELQEGHRGSENRRTSSSPIGAGGIDSPTVDYMTPFANEDRMMTDSSTLKTGDLVKTSRSRNSNKSYGLSRKRRFRVTEEAIEYFQPFSHVKVKKSFPITSIQEVKVLDDKPSSFQVVFKNFILDLEAPNPDEAENWVSVIRDCVSDWKIDEDQTIDRRAGKKFDKDYVEEIVKPDDSHITANNFIPRSKPPPPFLKNIISPAHSMDQGEPPNIRDHDSIHKTPSIPRVPDFDFNRGIPDLDPVPIIPRQIITPEPNRIPYHADGGSWPPPLMDAGPPHPTHFGGGSNSSINEVPQRSHTPPHPHTPPDSHTPPRSHTPPQPHTQSHNVLTSQFSFDEERKKRGTLKDFQPHSLPMIKPDEEPSYLPKVEPRDMEGMTTPTDDLPPPISISPASAYSDTISSVPTQPKPILRDTSSARARTPNRARSRSVGVMLKAWSTEDHTLQRKSGNSIKRRLHLIPKLQKQAPIVSKSKDEKDQEEQWRLLHEEYTMIKYPRRKWAAIPSEKIFQLDKDNLQIMWKKTSSSKAKISSTLKLDSILEMRLGQLTDGFEKFPYDEVADQSFSLIFEDIDGKYAKLGSLDLICDHPLHFDKWLDGLTSLQVGPVSAMFPTRYENTDPVLVWLKRFWSCYSNSHELSERDAVKLMKHIHPTIDNDNLRRFLIQAHNHQHEASYGNGYSLRWDGFVLLYNLLAGETGRLYALFQTYAKTHKRLGLTVDEFREFLIMECNYSNEDCQERRLKEMMAFHDHHHWAFKKFAGNNKPSNWKISKKLLSYAGFLSFLRSKHNAATDPLHDTVYQDMDQPLSHYFINSSHNTYLEADQIKGRSTLDAYVRALLQGARCVEIDCWDNATGKEPIIYHGFTFTSKLPLREVIRTINKYAFHMSHYPVIISIENHCNPQQQAKMAEIFNEEFRNELDQCIVATENLVEGEEECRRRLPSPTELQAMILLKGSYKNQTLRGPKKIHSKFNLPSPILSPIKRTSEPDLKTMDRKESVQETSPTGKGQWEWPEITENNNKPINNGSLLLTRGRTRRDARRFSSRIRKVNGNVEVPEDDQELVYTETATTLRDMIVYCRSTSIKPWSWKEQKMTSICQMFSFGEISATNHYKRSSKELLACTERQFVRTYPKGARIDSGNYSPIPFWNHGIQMVALNFQTPDIHMHLNQGRFRQNGGCGYVLKPEILRTVNPGGGKHQFDPISMATPHPQIPTCTLYIELASGQNLSVFGKTCLSVSVHISSHGIAADNHSMEPPATSSDTFCPNWLSGDKTFSHLILMPELCLIYFRVDVTLKIAGRNVTQLFGQNCIALPSLQPGIKFIQLRKSGGELIPESGLFVLIKTCWNEHSRFAHPDFFPFPASPDTPLSPTTPTEDDLTSRRSTLVRQDCVANSNITELSIPPTTVDSPPIEEFDDRSMVNLLDVDPASPNEVIPISNEVELQIEDTGPDTETQIATIEVTAEIN